MRTHYVVPVFLIIWLVVGALAAGQRGYYHQSDPSCGSVGSMLVTVLAGPLNYLESIQKSIVRKCRSLPSRGPVLARHQ